jgi:Rad3-related DNA helicase
MSVQFPVEPYDQQVEYVTNLIAALKEAQNTFLEYPRGGGRTLSILAGCLSWLFEQSEKKAGVLPKIFFVCRNYSRLPDVLFLKARSSLRSRKRSTSTR